MFDENDNQPGLFDKPQETICSHCGAKSVQYRYKFNYGLAVFLRKLVEAGGVAKTDDLGLTYSQRTNSQKLRYWGLAKAYLNEESKHKKGWWQVTERGQLFLQGHWKIPSVAIVVRNKVIRLEGPEISINDAVKEWKHYDHFAGQVVEQI